MDLSTISSLATKVYDFIPREELDMPSGLSLWDSRYLLSHLMPAYERATAIYQTLELPIRDPKEAVTGWVAFKDELDRIDGAGIKRWMTLAAATGPIGMAIVPTILTVKIGPHLYAGVISALYWTAVTGFYGHAAFKDQETLPYSIHMMVKEGKLTEAQAMAHAGWAYTAFKLMAQLERLGGLRPLKRGQSGLGAVPVAAILIGVLVVILILAGAVVLSKNLSEVNALRADVIKSKLETQKEICARATDPAVQVKCAEGPTAEDLSAGTFATELSKALAAMGTKLVKYVTIGLFAYLGITLLPSLVGGVKGGIKEAAS